MMYTIEQIDEALWNRRQAIIRDHLDEHPQHRNWTRLMEYPGFASAVWHSAGGHWGILYNDFTMNIDGKTLTGRVIDDTDAEWESKVYITIKVGDQYFTREGRRISHDGTYWDGDAYESFPQEVTQIQYRRK